MAADTRDSMCGTNSSIFERGSSFSRLSPAMVGRAHKLEAAEPANAGSCRATLQEGDHGAKITRATEVTAIAVSTVPSNCQPKRRGMLWEWKSLKELNELDCDQLQRLCAELALLIKQISFELAPLLEEHHSLQEEVDARNVVIHQLLKLTCKQAEFPHRPIQMSVIFPDNKTETLDLDAASDN